ncbi:MAG TPA: chemotaxis-specific protein-glutamate methyltransferase CheB, partial [Treponemataceae bacterium]|nr:chemotaxis-specific protein-glutamate methyltransferase CheB [Treponemataceae bacterium]
QIADKAMNGRFALQKIAKAKPDIIVLDIEMPEMNGIEFLKERKKIGLDIPVIILSSIAKEGAKVTMECLELGASDFVTKPSGSESADLHTVAAQLVEMLQGYGGQYQLKKIAGTARRIPEELLKSYESRLIDPETGHYQRKTGIESLYPGSPDLFHQDTAAARAVQTGKPAAAKPVPVRKPGPIEIIAIGISTGGPNALREVFAKIDPNLKQPIVVVQHMPAGFTEEFANSLNRICPLEVKEAQEGDLVKPGRILIAPGDKHLEVEKRPLASIAHITDASPQNGHRPSADVLFGSIAREYQNRALGIIMTGMGRDGAAKLAELYAEGSRTLGQDEKSSIVYGMPRVAWELGGVMEQVSLSDMAEAINKYAREFAH